MRVPNTSPPLHHSRYACRSADAATPGRAWRCTSEGRCQPSGRRRTANRPAHRVCRILRRCPLRCVHAGTPGAGRAGGPLVAAVGHRRDPRSTGPGNARASTASTRPHRRSADRCMWATCSPTPTPTASPGTSGCGVKRCSIRWGGTTTDCPPNAGSRTTTASAATRPFPTTAVLSSGEARRQTTDPDLATQLRRTVRTAHGRGREGFRGVVAPSGHQRRLAPDLPDHRPQRPHHVSTGVPEQPGARRGLSPRPPPCGTSPSGRPWRKRNWRTGNGPAPITGCPSTGPTASRCSSRPPVRNSWRPALSWWPIPTTSGTSRCSGHGDDAGLRRRGARRGSRTGGPEKGPASP